MINLANKIIAYLGRKPNFDTEVLLQDDAIGGVSNPYIKEWNVDGVAQPTEEQLSAVASQAQTMEDNHVVRKTRKKAYGDIGDQLDEIFKDIDAWKTRIQAIKNSNPKS